MILFIDDEPMYVHYYLQNLKTRFSNNKVIFRDNLKEARELINNHISELEILIIDIMMPPDDKLDFDEVDKGLKTGLFFLKQIAEQLYIHQVPVLILTNRDPNKIADEINELRKSLTRLEIRQKIDTPAFVLPNIVEVIIKN